jgi:hypothetical protein
MIKDTYPYVQVRDELAFVFRSEGINGVIVKVVIFTLKNDGKWNLAFGDWRNGDIDDKVMTNNHDVVKVIGTVAKVTYAFFEKYPDAIVVVDPVDEKRKKLYNVVFQRHYATINRDFQVKSFIGEQIEIYSPSKIYDSFELSLKTN